MRRNGSGAVGSPRDSGVPATEFVWKTREGEFIPVGNMHTTHLFYSIRMIWNHIVEPRHQLPGGRYDIGWIGNRDHVTAALRGLSCELARRGIDKLPPRLRTQMAYMIACGAVPGIGLLERDSHAPRRGEFSAQEGE